MVVVADARLELDERETWTDLEDVWSTVAAVPAELDDSCADSAVFRRFLDVRGRARQPVACVNERFLFMNSAAAGLLGYEHRDELWACARSAIERGEERSCVLLSAGRPLAASCSPILWHGRLVGAEIRLSDRHAASDSPAARTSFGWASLRDSEVGIAQLVAEGLTNREVGARLYLSRHTIDFHLRQIYRKLAINSRVELTRLVLQHAAADHEGQPAGAW